MADRELTNNLIDGEQKNLPYDLESERALLALCLKNSSKLNDILKGRITEDDFYDARHKLIYGAISKLYVSSGKIDPYTVADYLRKEGTLKKAGNNEYVISLIDSYAVSANADDYVAIITEKSKLRLLISTFEDMTSQAKKNSGSVNAIVDLAISRLSAMREAPEGVGFESLASIIKKNINEITQIKTGNSKGKIYKTGFSYVDHLLGGLRPGTLNIIAARPGMGKSAFVINIAVNAAELYNSNINIFSLEMSKSEIGNRIISSRTTTSSKKLQSANVTDNELFEIAKSCQNISTLPIYIDDNSNVNPVSMLSSCKQLKVEGKLGLIIVDYLQLMSMPSAKGSQYSRQNEISDISRSLKVMAKELEVPIIALSQLSRGSEKRDDHTPMLSDLRDSGAIEQDADSVIFIDRDDYYDKDKRSNEIQDAKIIIAKNRHGEPGVAKLKWHGARTLFYEEDRKSDPSEQNVSPYARTTTPGGAASDYKFDDQGGEIVPDMTPPPEAPVDSYSEPALEAAPFADPDAYTPPPENDDMSFDGFDGGLASELPEGWGEG